MFRTQLRNAYDFYPNPRPIWFAYFIREDDMLALHYVAGLASTQWGGAYSLIVPVSDGNAVPGCFLDMLALHDPDVCVNLTRDESPAAVAALRQTVSSAIPRHGLRIVDGSYFEDDDRSAHVLMSQQEAVGRRLTVPGGHE